MVTKNQNSVTDTHRRERNPNITLKIIIKSQGKRRNKELQKCLKMIKRIAINTIHTHPKLVEGKKS